MSEARTSRSRTTGDDTDLAAEETLPDTDAALLADPEATPLSDAAPLYTAPTLREAFYILCEALAPHLADDLPRWTHTQDIQSWMHDAGDDATGHAQEALAWTHAVQLLEGVLGRSLLQR
jgi:hypothetical protein